MTWIRLLTFTYKASEMWIARTWPFKLNLISEPVTEASLPGTSHCAPWVWKGARSHIQNKNICLPCCLHADINTANQHYANKLFFLNESLMLVILRVAYLQLSTYWKLFFVGLKYKCNLPSLHREVHKWLSSSQSMMNCWKRNQDYR